MGLTTLSSTTRPVLETAILVFVCENISDSSSVSLNEMSIKSEVTGRRISLCQMKELFLLSTKSLLDEAFESRGVMINTKKSIPSSGTLPLMNILKLF